MLGRDSSVVVRHSERRVGGDSSVVGRIACGLTGGPWDGLAQ
ncbi:hypothetical protein [Arthrobacter sp. 2MCAF15]